MLILLLTACAHDCEDVADLAQDCASGMSNAAATCADESAECLYDAFESALADESCSSGDDAAVRAHLCNCNAAWCGGDTGSTTGSGTDTGYSYR